MLPPVSPRIRSYGAAGARRRVTLFLRSGHALLRATIPGVPRYKGGEQTCGRLSGLPTLRYHKIRIKQVVGRNNTL